MRLLLPEVPEDVVNQMRRVGGPGGYAPIGRGNDRQILGAAVMFNEYATAADGIQRRPWAGGTQVSTAQGL